MADSKRGSKTWALALSETFSEPPTFWPAWAEVGDPSAKGWFCGHGGGITGGYGLTLESAWVDYVEEIWCFCGVFPKGYPD